ncbi:PaaX family transcriptional regulator C-terminal domain-containing protein [Streptomyces sp. SCSIO 75703]|uniref:PaaX family transcriptional regulator n=1 Tax=unclassified Streptomyces TaxID=2593676 RepID=UPI0004C2A4E0|nr:MULTISPECIES: PaaX family transcriptional regulator C-terminal domain-containing protein [unclassified Streptomyces]
MSSSGNELRELGKASDEAAAALPTQGWLEPPQPQDLVLTLLADNVRNRLESVWSGGLVQLIGEFGFSTGASRVALARLVRRDLISRVKEGRLVSYRLTDRAERLLAEGDRRIFHLGGDRGRGDVFTVLWHTLPEKRRLERGQLARRLRFLGFGSVQDGNWISVGDHEEEVVRLVTELGVGEFCSLVTGRLSTAFSLRPIVERAWDLPALNDRYDAFVREFGAAQEAAGQGDATAFRVRTQLMHNFRQFPALDPGLPPPLMPEHPARAAAISLLDRAYATLREPAQRHFDAVVGAGGG